MFNDISFHCNRIATTEGGYSGKVWSCEFCSSGEALPLGQANRNNYKNFLFFLSVRMGVGVLGQFVCSNITSPKRPVLTTTHPSQCPSLILVAFTGLTTTDIIYLLAHFTLLPPHQNISPWGHGLHLFCFLPYSQHSAQSPAQPTLGERISWNKCHWILLHLFGHKGFGRVLVFLGFYFLSTFVSLLIFLL